LAGSVPKQLGVELHGRINVGDVEGELDSGHDQPTLAFVSIDAFIMVDTSMDVNGRGSALIDTAVEACCPSVFALPLEEATAAELAAGFAALADPARLRVISILAAAEGGEVCVCELVEPLGKAQPTVSHHLKVLGDAGLVVGDRRSKWVWYSLVRSRLEALQSALQL
jgi:ArsR family transcriptional regulator